MSFKADHSKNSAWVELLHLHRGKRETTALVNGFSSQAVSVETDGLAIILDITCRVIDHRGFLRIIRGFAKYAFESYGLVTIVKTLPPALLDENESKEPVFRRWSHEDAAELRRTQPVISPWRVVRWMLMSAVGVGVISLIVFDVSTALSSTYGSLVVALPAALLARGMTSKLSSANAISSALAFMVWEMVKLGLSISMLMLASSLIVGLSWPALLAGLVLTMQVYFVAAIVKPKPSGRVTESTLS